MLRDIKMYDTLEGTQHTTPVQTACKELHTICILNRSTNLKVVVPN